MEDRSIEVSVGGQWKSVPALNVQGKNIIVVGKLVRIAVVHDEEWLETELDDPEVCVTELKTRDLHGLWADIFTFTQKPPETVPRYGCPMELDSIAAAAASDFTGWW